MIISIRFQDINHTEMMRQKLTDNHNLEGE